MNLDDPKLTAYALGEITDLADIAEVETWLATNSEGRAYVTESRELAAWLGQALHSEDAPGLTEAQRAALLNGTYETNRTYATSEEAAVSNRSHESYKSYKSQKNPPSLRRPWSILALTALAACLAAAPLLPWAELLRLRDSKAPTLAINEKPMTLQMPSDEVLGRVGVSPAAEGILPDASSGQDSHPTRDKNSSSAEPEISSASSAILLGVPDENTAPPVPQARQIEKFDDKIAGLKKNQPTFAAPSSSLAATSGPADSAGAATLDQTRLAAAFKSQAVWSVDSEWERPIPKGKPAPKKTERKGAFLDTNTVVHKDAEHSNTEAYDAVTENDFLAARENPLSTFSIDVDTASYANVRRMLNEGQLPPKGAVRIEEMLNYFTYDYAKPEGDAPFSTNLEVATCPWQPEHRLVRIGLKGKEIPMAERKAANLVFLIDVSGSMDEPNKLPLLKQSLRLLVDQLGENDRVALTVYAGSSGLVLPSTANKEAIRAALDNLKAGGSTNGASGIKLAYEQAVANFQKDGINRVILATDGDFNVGVTNQSDLNDLITEKAKSGVFLSVLGFGTGNIKDSTMEKLADKGNGNYAYIDSLQEGKKVLVEQMGGTLVTIAKDVKIQVEFNPAVVSNYRLVGYENRALKKEDFANDKKDAGEIGAGHTVTALYEVVMVGSMSPEVQAEPLKYSNNASNQVAILPSGEMLTVKLRYKEPSGDVSKLLEFPLTDNHKKLDTASKDFQFASAVAEFAELLRKSEHSQLASWESLIARATESKGEDRGGYRAEFIELAKKAEALTKRNDS